MLSKKVLQFDVGSFLHCGPPADRWDVVVSKKEKKGLHPRISALKWNLGPLDGLVVSEKKGLYPKFGDLKWKPGTLDGYVTSPKITKRSLTIIWGLQSESGALRQLRGSLTSLLWDLYDGLLNALSWTPTHPWVRGRLPPVIPSPPLLTPGWGRSCSVSFVSLTFSWDDLFYSIRANIVILAKTANFVLHLAPQCPLIVLKGLHVISFHRPASGSEKLPHRKIKYL